MEENKVKSGKEILDDFFKKFQLLKTLIKRLPIVLQNYMPMGN
jgi:hypothetical protein